jgi:DNA-binding response OmpR family regulator
VVLDVMLPGYDGHEVCRRIQADRPVPVLMLTARVDEADVLVGLGVGADDYLTKPFRMRELVARVAALLRRVERADQLARESAGPQGSVELGALRLDAGARRTWIGDDELHLTPTEFDLLCALASAPGQVLTRERLLAQVWGWDGGAGATRTVDSHVKALRSKIGAERVRTVHGVGYALENV